MRQQPRTSNAPRRVARRLAAAAVALALLAGCAAPPARGISDPYEVQNRRVHEFNRSVDRAIVRPLSRAIGGDGPPGPIAEGVSNLARNLALPAAVVNKTLQFRFADAVHNTVRFVLNSTVGIGGLLDPAAALGLEARTTDFGETLHRWGVPEGNFIELPLVGPSTDRDALGLVVDTLADPVGLFLPAPWRYYARGVKLASKLGDRARFGGTVDSILYDSADSYAQIRLLYLQNRRFELGQEAHDEDFLDPYEDLFGD